MTQKLPPLFTLQAFEAAARLASFSQAAAELHLTPGAVSRQIRLLEDWSKQTLFKRQGPRVSLTEAGIALLARLEMPLAALHQAIYPAPESQQKTVQIATLASFAKSWLLPRLASFKESHPELRLIIDTHYAFIKAAPRMATLALRYGGSPQEGYLHTPLFEDYLVAVTSPALAAKLGPAPINWPACTLLQHLPLDPQAWLQAAGIAPQQQVFADAFNDSDVLLEAAQQGLGVALARLSNAWPRLQQGVLVLACPVYCAAAQSYQMVIRADSAALPELQTLQSWLVEQAQSWRQQMADFIAGSELS